MLQADLFREQFEIREKLVNTFLSKKTCIGYQDRRETERTGWEMKGSSKKKKRVTLDLSS